MRPVRQFETGSLMLKIHFTSWVQTAGPHPYPLMVRSFQSVIGNETRYQILEAESRLPDYVLACIGGGSNSMGIFYSFLQDKGVQLIGLEAGGYGIETNMHAASLNKGKLGIVPWLDELCFTG